VYQQNEKLYKHHRMRSKICIFVVLVLILLAMPTTQVVEAAENKEYQIKAAFLYNFIKFVDWPKEKMSDVNEPIVVGIIGKDPFGNAIDIITGEHVKDKKLVVRWFNSFEDSKKSDEKNKPGVHREIEAIRKCHLLFFCSSEKNDIEEIMKPLKGSHVLTVGDMNGFLESGGVINFIIENKKVRFEINIPAAKRAGLEIRAQLLRLAKRVIKEDTLEDNKKHSNARSITRKPIIFLL